MYDRLELNSGFRFTLSGLMFGMVVIGGMLMVVVWVRDARQVSLQHAAQRPLWRLTVALHNYHDTFDCFPPAYLADANGKPAHSWRVLILPYCNGHESFDAYSFNEPYNGPNNSKLSTRMPAIFHVVGEEESNQYTNIMLITGPGTAFPGSKSTSLADFTDGPRNVILMSEIANSTTPWLQPTDLRVDRGGLELHNPDTLHISSVYWRDPHVSFAGSPFVQSVNRNIAEDDLRALSTIAGQEPVYVEGID